MSRMEMNGTELLISPLSRTYTTTTIECVNPVDVDDESVFLPKTPKHYLPVQTVELTGLNPGDLILVESSLTIYREMAPDEDWRISFIEPWHRLLDQKILTTGHQDFGREINESSGRNAGPRNNGSSNSETWIAKSQATILESERGTQWLHFTCRFNASPVDGLIHITNAETRVIHYPTK